MKPQSMSQEYYDHYQGRLEGTQSGYAPLLQQLRDRFGANFLVENMGGGCEAIRAVTEGGWEIRITDGEDFIWPKLAEREERETAGEPQGWCIGIYKILNADEETDLMPTVGVVERKARTGDLIGLIEGALGRLAAGDHDHFDTFG